MTKCAIVTVGLAIAQVAFGQGTMVRLGTITPGSDLVPGISEAKITAFGFSATTIPPANVTVTFATTCGGTPKGTASATGLTRIHLDTTNSFTPLASVAFTIPSNLTPGTTYYVSIADTVSGDPNFTSGNCVTATLASSAPILNACIAGSSLGVLLPRNGAPGNVTAYVPKGHWENSTTGVYVKNIEGALGAGSTIPTPNAANSCSSNPATGQTVCVANNTDVYLISGTTLTNTLTSGSNSYASFSGGDCQNCGVALDASNNTAVINMGMIGGSGGGLQVLNLNTNTFQPPLVLNNEVSENISVDPTRSLILSAGEDGNYTLVQTQTNGTLKEFDPTFKSGIENDSSAEDCSTGIAISPAEYSFYGLQMVNLNNISFGATTYTAPNSVTLMSTNYTTQYGFNGSAVAQGSGHLAVLAGEFGDNLFAVVKLPAAAGTGTPSLVDYVITKIPSNSACGGAFVPGFDPHTVTAYTSPNTGDSYAVFAGYSGNSPICLAVVDMTTLINPALAPRGGGGYAAHDISPANLPSSAIRFFSIP